MLTTFLPPATPAPATPAPQAQARDRAAGPGGGAAGEPVETRYAGAAGEPWGAPQAVLLDRDGTLVADVPYNGDPRRVRPMPTTRAALDTLRAYGVAVGVVTNQSGLARDLITPGQLAAVQRRIETLLGPFDVWAVCPHRPEDRCPCRKPAPGLVLDACRRLGVEPGRAVVVGDIAADVGAARAAGARGVLVPTAATRPEEVARATETAPDLLTAARLILRPQEAA